MRLRLIDGVDAVPAARWDALVPADYPFLRHAFLSALERHGCASPAKGWQPQHALLESVGGELLGLAPLYAKRHSYGEFVFDFSWAEASHSIGQPYYPKWLVAIPFTPAAGPRLAACDAAAHAELLTQLRAHFDASGCSSLHALFLQGADASAAETAGAALRHDVQFHWRNSGYADFTEFLARLTHDKRKKILRERRRVAEAGIRFEWRAGDTLDEAEWATVYALYSNTYEERGQAPYLSLAFFFDYARAPGSPVRLILAYEGSRMVAAAITIQGGDCLYGRHWGAAEHYHSLHFETCYYQGIEYCIAHGLARYDAGAQGAHKLARGFEPVLTTSAHWIAEPRLRRAVQQALKRERAAVLDWRDALAGHAPFKAAEGPAPVAPALEAADG